MKKLYESSIEDLKHQLSVVQNEINENKKQIHALIKKNEVLEKEGMYFLGISEYLESIEKEKENLLKKQEEVKTKKE